MIGCCEGEFRYCCLKSYWVIYFSNVLWDYIPDANCPGVKGERCSVGAAPCNGHGFLMVLIGPVVV